MHFKILKCPCHVSNVPSLKNVTKPEEVQVFALGSLFQMCSSSSQNPTVNLSPVCHLLIIKLIFWEMFGNNRLTCKNPSLDKKHRNTHKDKFSNVLDELMVD